MNVGPDAKRVTRHLRIAGRVQGVGYRDALRGEAIARGIAGWVRNRQDGSVEALLQGSAKDVDAVANWARHGPSAARVDSVEVNDVVEGAGGEFDRRYAGFDWLPTA